jgi:hypothetical protein
MQQNVAKLNNHFRRNFLKQVLKRRLKLCFSKVSDPPDAIEMQYIILSLSKSCRKLIFCLLSVIAQRLRIIEDWTLNLRSFVRAHSNDFSALYIS